VKEGQPSRTAQRVAMRRAAHQLLDAPLVFPDPLALTMLGPDREAALRADPRSAERSPLGSFLRAFLVARSRVAEDTLAELVAQGVTRYVVLGAGLDTFACRNPWPALRVWEVDFPATQTWKRQRLAEVGIAAPERTTFVAIDFARERLADALAAAGLDAGAPTFFSWLGVTPYLPESAVWETLAVVAGATRAGGGIVFDYSVPPSSLGTMSRLAFAAMAARVRAAGEPWTTFFDPAELMRRMRDLGFATVEDLSGEALNDRYFAGRSDGLRVGSAGRILRAITPPRAARRDGA
jgi:methyltransferase (TIGR00027 family)